MRQHDGPRILSVGQAPAISTVISPAVCQPDRLDVIEVTTVVGGFGRAPLLEPDPAERGSSRICAEDHGNSLDGVPRAARHVRQLRFLGPAQRKWLTAIRVAEQLSHLIEDLDRYLVDLVDDGLDVLRRNAQARRAELLASVTSSSIRASALGAHAGPGS